MEVGCSCRRYAYVCERSYQTPPIFLYNVEKKSGKCADKAIRTHSHIHTHTHTCNSQHIKMPDVSNTGGLFTPSEKPHKHQLASFNSVMVSSAPLWYCIWSARSHTTVPREQLLFKANGCCCSEEKK